MNYLVIDTCVILHILRNNSIGQAALSWIGAQTEDYTIVISVVTKGELQSLKLQQKWGAQRCNALDSFLSSVTYIDLSHADDELLEEYAQIDAYSKGKGEDKNGNMKTGSSAKMGKNDLWIAATASVIQATLLTSDGDFDHLNGVFLNVQKF